MAEEGRVLVEVAGVAVDLQVRLAPSRQRRLILAVMGHEVTLLLPGEEVLPVPEPAPEGEPASRPNEEAEAAPAPAPLPEAWEAELLEEAGRRLGVIDRWTPQARVARAVALGQGDIPALAAARQGEAAYQTPAEPLPFKNEVYAVGHSRTGACILTRSFTSFAAACKEGAGFHPLTVSRAFPSDIEARGYLQALGIPPDQWQRQ